MNISVTCEDFIIDVSKVQSFKYLQSKQFDHNSRRRRLIITNSNIPIKYSDDRSEYITLSLSIGEDNYSNTSCPFEDDGYPYITFTEDMLSRSGDINCEIRIFDHKNGTIISTFPFMMTVTKSLLNHDRLVKSSEFNILNDLILQALSIRELIHDFETSKNTIDSMIAQINKDIDSYRLNFELLSVDARNIINELTDYLNISTTNEQSRVEAERLRVEAENNRQKTMSNKISELEQRFDESVSGMRLVISDMVSSINSKIEDKINEINQYINSFTTDIDSILEDKIDNYLKKKPLNSEYILNLKEAITNNSQNIDDLYQLIMMLHGSNSSNNINGGSSVTEISNYNNDYNGGDAIVGASEYGDMLDGGKADTSNSEYKDEITINDCISIEDVQKQLNDIDTYNKTQDAKLKQQVIENSKNISYIEELIKSFHESNSSDNVDGGYSIMDNSEYIKNTDGGDSTTNLSEYDNDLDGGDS